MRLAIELYDPATRSFDLTIRLYWQTLFIVEGRAAILSERIGLDSFSEPPFYAFMAWGDNTIEMGLGANMDIPKSGAQQGRILEMYADVQAKFFLNTPGMWYANFGTEEVPIQSRILDLFNAKSYLQISAQGIKGAARVDFELKKTYGPAKAHVKAYFEKGGYISFEKPQIGAYIAAGGMVDVDIWFIGFSISVDALFSVEVPEPFKIYAEVKIKVCAKVLFVKKCFKFTIELNWERNDTVPTPYKLDYS